MRTHRYCDAKQSADDAVDIVIDLFVARLSTVHRPVCLLAHTQAEQVGFADNEVQVLVEDLTDALGGVRLGRLRCEVFEQWPWNGREEVDVCRRIQAVLQVLSDALQVRRCRLNEIHHRYIGYGMPLSIDVSGDRNQQELREAQRVLQDKCP